MSAIVNARDVLLQAAPTRLSAVNMQTNVTVNTVNIADNAVTTTKIVDAAISTAKFASGIEPVSIVSSLPSPSGYTGPKAVFLTTDKKIYRYDSATPAWTTAVPTGDLTGQITTTQITDAAISTPKIAANAVTANEIATDAVTASKIIAGAVTTAKLAAGAVTANEIAANAVTASKILAGTITTDRLVANAATVASASANTAVSTTPASTDTLVTYTETNGISLTTTGSPVKYVAAVHLAFICGTGVDYMFVELYLQVDGVDTSWISFGHLRATNFGSDRRGVMTLPLVGRETGLSAASHTFKVKALVRPYDSTGANVQWGGATRTFSIQTMVFVEENKV